MVADGLRIPDSLLLWLKVPSGVVFIRDFVQLQVLNDCIYGRVNQFYSKVLHGCI